MNRSFKLSAVALFGTPHLLVASILMFIFWAAAAEIYSVLLTRSRGDAFVAAMLSIITVPFSFWLFANFLRLAHDLRELCVPQRRRLLTGALSLLLLLTWVLPCGLLALGHWAFRDLLLGAMAMPAGIAVAFLWRRTVRRMPAATAGFCRPRRALRTILGPPYAPAPLGIRALQGGLVCAVFTMPPVLVGVFGGALSRMSFAAAVHAAELLGFLAAIGLCWIWPLSRAVMIFSPAHGALGELALLPGIGNGRRALQRLLLISISVPAVGLITLLILSLGVVWREQLPVEIYWKVIGELLLVLFVTLPIAISQIAHPRSVGAWKPFFMMSQIWIFSISLWTVPLSVLPLFVALRWLAWLTMALVLGALIFVVSTAMHSLREIFRRPQPFVELSP